MEKVKKIKTKEMCNAYYVKNKHKVIDIDKFLIPIEQLGIIYGEGVEDYPTIVQNIEVWQDVVFHDKKFNKRHRAKISTYDHKYIYFYANPLSYLIQEILPGKDIYAFDVVRVSHKYIKLGVLTEYINVNKVFSYSGLNVKVSLKINLRENLNVYSVKYEDILYKIHNMEDGIEDLFKKTINNYDNGK